MGFDAIAHYFTSGGQALMGEAALNWSSVTSLLNLATLLDVLLVLGLLGWVYQKIKGTALARMLPKVALVLLLMFLAKLFGLLALFYVTFAGLIILLIATAIIYTADFRKIIAGDLLNKLSRKNLADGEYDAKKFVSELSDAVALLAKSKTASLMVIKTDLPLGKVNETGTHLYTPFSKEFVWDVFSHRSKLSSGAMIVDKGVIVVAGSTLSTHAPKRFVFSPTNAAILHMATNYDAIVIITYKDKEEVSVLHKKSAYTKLAVKNIDRVLKNILL